MLSPSPLPASMEPDGKLNVPCDCFSSKGSGTFNESLAFVVIIPRNSVLECNKIDTHIILMQKYNCFTRTQASF